MMNTVNKMIDALFGESNPGGYFLLSLVSYILLMSLQNFIKSKMNAIARISDPTLRKDNPFTRVLLQGAEVWDDPDWRKLKFRHAFLGYISIIALLFGLWFGFTSLILVIGALFG